MNRVRPYPERGTIPSGMTLIEVLAVITVLGLLAALLLPAIQSMRESQRRLQCEARLIEMGRALQAFEGIFHVYPAAMASEAVMPYQPGNQSARFIAPHVRLLPYLDQAALYDQIDLDPSLTITPPYDFSQATNVAGMKSQLTPDQLRLTIFLCPSDRPDYPNTTFNNFRANLGRGPGSGFKAAAGVADPSMVVASGAFVLGQGLTTADFKDGDTHTIAFSERVRGNGDPNRYSRGRDIFYSGLSGMYPKGGLTLDVLTQVCDAVSDATTEFYPYAGGSWFFSSYDQTWYNHALAPNSPIADCAVDGLLKTRPPKTTSALVGARSYHSQGVNCVFMDGHTGFIANGIDLSVWRALSTRAGAERGDFNY